jgi:hypothetical protein
MNEDQPASRPAPFQTPPVFVNVRPQRRLGVFDRVLAGVVAIACLAVLVVAARLTPSPAGHGTHTQLGLDPCGWLLRTGSPCMTCGMTTAFAHAARFEVTAAARTQPAGFVAYLLTPFVFWACAYAACTGLPGAWWWRQVRWGKILLAAGAILAAGWAYTWATWRG